MVAKAGAVGNRAHSLWKKLRVISPNCKRVLDNNVHSQCERVCVCGLYTEEGVHAQCSASCKKRHWVYYTLCVLIIDGSNNSFVSFAVTLSQTGHCTEQSINSCTLCAADKQHFFPASLPTLLLTAECTNGSRTKRIVSPFQQKYWWIRHVHIVATK